MAYIRRRKLATKITYQSEVRRVGLKTIIKNEKDQISIQNSVDKIAKILPKINKNYSGLLIDLNKNILPY